MTFLAAAFFAGLAALAVPLWLHRTNQRAPAEATVASLMLMREADEPVRQRRALAHKVLLALRLALLALVVFAFAQPVLERAAVGSDEDSAAAARLIVVDGSLSMHRRGVWPQAMAMARRLRDEGAGPVRFALATDTLMLVDGLADLQPGWARFDFADLPGALDAIALALPEAPGGWRAHVVSDFQASAVPERFNALIGAEGFAQGVRLHAVGEAGGNWAVESVRVVGERVQAVVASFADRQRELAVTLANASEVSADVKTVRMAVPAGTHRQVEFPLPAPAHAPTAWRVAIADADDALPEDDARLFVRPGTAAAVVGVLAPHGGAALQFLEAALAASPSARPVALQDDSWPSRLAAIVALDPGQLSTSQQRRLRRHVDEGGGVLLLAGPATQRRGALPLTGAALHANPAATVRRVLPAAAGHPLAEGAWDEVTVTRSLALPATPAETILSLVPSAAAPSGASGEPLLVEKRVGRGRMLVLLTALNRDWSNLVLRPAFVTLVHGAIDYLAREKPLLATVGEPVAIGGVAVQLFDQSGTRVPGLQQGINAAGRALRVEQPGVYTARSPGSETLLAVNVDARESDPRPVSAEFLARWQAALAPHATPNTPAGEDSPPSTTPLAGALLLLALLLLLAESVAANTGWPFRFSDTRQAAA